MPVRMCLICSDRKLYHKNMNLQTFISSFHSSNFPHVTRVHTAGFFHPDLHFSVKLGSGYLGLLMKNRVKSGCFEVINSSATSMCSIL